MGLDASSRYCCGGGWRLAGSEAPSAEAVEKRDGALRGNYQPAAAPEAQPRAGRARRLLADHSGGIEAVTAHRPLGPGDPKSGGMQTDIGLFKVCEWKLTDGDSSW